MDRTRRQAIDVDAVIALRARISRYSESHSKGVARIDLLPTASPFTWLLFPAHDHPSNILSRPEWVPHPRTGCKIEYEEVYFESLSSLRHVHYRFSGDNLSSRLLSMRSATTLLFRTSPYLAITTRSQSSPSGSNIYASYRRRHDAEAVEDLT